MFTHLDLSLTTQRCRRGGQIVRRGMMWSWPRASFHRQYAAVSRMVIPDPLLFEILLSVLLATRDRQRHGPLIDASSALFFMEVSQLHGASGR